LSLLRPKRLSAIAALVLLTAAAGARAQAEGYKPHMENGVKLYNDRNYPAAIVEFRAAYDARPGPNPLLNIALCEKALFQYPRAIAALEQALGKHTEAMDASDRQAAVDAIRDMRALLGRVALKINPPQATVLIDGELVGGTAVDLGPGAHRVEIRADGFTSVERTLTVASGQAQEVVVALVAEVGSVVIDAEDPDATITIDGKEVGKGSWKGELSPGQHAVRLILSRGRPYETTVQIVSGKDVVVRTPKKEAGPRRGLYLFGTGTILFPLVNSPYIDQPKFDFGAGYGLRIGYQVNDIAGFDVSYQHSIIANYNQNDTDGKMGFRLVTERVALGLRLTTPGKMWRFVGMFGGGFAYDRALWGDNVMDPHVCVTVKDKSGNDTCPLQGNVRGFDAYGLIELLAELDVDSVLINLGVEAQFQATGGVAKPITLTDINYYGSIYGTRPIINIGPALRVGYRFW
jgi:hypothetical protein